MVIRSAENRIEGWLRRWAPAPLSRCIDTLLCGSERRNAKRIASAWFKGGSFTGYRSPELPVKAGLKCAMHPRNVGNGN